MFTADSPTRPRTRARLLAIGGMIAALSVTSACGSSGGNSSGGDPASAGANASTSSDSGSGSSVTIADQQIKTDPTLAATVPAAVRNIGALKDITYNNAPPDESVVDGKLVGWEVDLGQAVATVLGLKWEATASGAFDSFIPGLQNGRYNVSFTSFIQTPERLKQIDIVTYFNVGTGFAVKNGSGISIKSATDLCGHSVAVLGGSAFIQQLQGIKCAGAGKKAIDVQSFPSDSASELAVSSSRAEIYSSSSNQLAWLIKQTKAQFELQPLDYMPVPEGAGLTKGLGLSKPIADAMDVLIKSGAYAAIMKKWSITDGLVDHATVYSDSK
jgi:polar amino acid transport system substrate-binding protein